MFAIAVMLAALVAFLLSTGPAFGTGRGMAGSAATGDGVIDIGQPMSIEKEITAIEVAGGIVSYDVAIYNHSPVDSLRLGALLDADLGDLNGRGSCSVPQVVQAMAVYRCSFTDQLGSD